MDGTIKEFIKETVEEIQAGLPEGYEVSNEIKFNISLITTTNKKGGINIKIATGVIDKEKQTVHNINFGVVNPKKQRETMHQTAVSVISYIKQGLTAFASVATEISPPSTEVKEV
jgi:hypothetical protein